MKLIRAWMVVNENGNPAYGRPIIQQEYIEVLYADGRKWRTIPVEIRERKPKGVKSK